MRSMVRSLVFVALAAAVPGAAWAAGDMPSAPSGFAGPAPLAAGGAASIAPSLGTGSTDPAEVSARGAEIVRDSAAFPANGMATVAYGAGGLRTESIINWDSRTRAYTTTYPDRAIVFIEYNGAHLCTGWLYANNMVATAGHCVHTGGSKGSWYTASKYKVYAGRDGTTSPYGSCTVKWTRSVTGWTSSGDYRYDYGAMRLNCTIGNTVGWFGMYYNTSPVGQPAIIGGYPGDKPRTMWTSADRIRYASTEMIAYRMDTVGGNSGSPIWHDRDEALATTGAWAFGIHNYGVGTFGSNTNAAARLNSARITNYTSWKNLP